MRKNKNAVKSAFSDGSHEDNQYFEETAKGRRQIMDGHSAIQKVLWYLDRKIEVMEIDVRRFRDSGEEQARLLAEERIKWTENIKLWIDRNI